MKFNMKLISLILILFFISVSAVCAEDSVQTADDTTEPVSDIDNIDEVQSNDIYTANSTAAGPKGFHDLQQQIWKTEAGSTIELDCDYVSDGVREWDIGIDRQLTIDGKGHTLDGKNAQGIFTVSSGVTNVVIKNVNFINGVRNCGAAIHAYNGANNLIVDNCTFKNNKATTDNVGGAILITANNCKITNCYFEGNVAKTSGGAIRLEGDSNTIANCIFKENKATGALGGAINALGHSNKITGNTFIKNVAARDGGAICIEGTKLEDMGIKNVISYNVFDSNKATGSSEGSYGGAISMAGENCEISYNNFTNNHADTLGGAIRWNGASGTMGKIIGNIIANSDARSGGAIYIAGNKITISNNKFSNNKVTTGAGGTINIKGDSAVISDNEITGSSTKAHGGAIYIEGKNIQLKNDTLSKCSAGDNGGGAYLYGSGSVTDCTFTDCSATSYGGGIFFKNTDFTLRGTTFESDSAGKGGDDYWPTDIPSGKIKTTLTATDVTTTYGKKSYVIATLKDKDGNPISGAKIGFSNNGVTYVTTDNDGKARYYTTELSPGTYTVNVKFSGDDNYDPSSATSKVTINKVETKLTAKYDKDSKNIVATVKDADGNPISGIKVGFAIDGVKYVTTDAKGQAKYSTADLADGSYSVQVAFLGDDNYNPSNKEIVTFTIGNQEQSKIYLRNALYFALQTKIVQVTLWDANNNPIANKTVYIQLNNDTWKYSGVTDEDGNAYIRVGVGFGVHNATVSFDGDENYSASERSGSVRVIKETPSVMVRGVDSEFKASDNPKIVKVYLRDRYNKPLREGIKVFFRINGQQYAGIADSDGIAHIAINVNKKGTYNAQAIFMGNSAYNPVTRDIKIYIK